MVWSDHCRWFEVDIQVGIDVVVPKIVFLQHWIFELSALLFHILNGHEYCGTENEVAYIYSSVVNLEGDVDVVLLKVI